jgi:hypothetical protein
MTGYILELWHHCSSIEAYLMTLSACGDQFHRKFPAYARAQHSALTSRICSTVEQGAASNSGLAKMTARQRAREIATLSRLRLKRNSRLRGMSSAEDVAIEIRTIAASCP